MDPAQIDDADTELASDGEGAPELVYRWTIRLMYLALIGANLYVLYDANRDSPPLVELRAKIGAKLAAWRKAAEECEGCAKRKAALAAAANRVIYEATEIVEGARHRGELAGDEGGPGAEAAP